MTTFSIRRFVCQVAVIGSLFTTAASVLASDNTPAKPDAPKTQLAKPANLPAVHRPHTAGRDFDTIY
jgi:hypothetical protein